MYRSITSSLLWLSAFRRRCMIICKFSVCAEIEHVKRPGESHKGVGRKKCPEVVCSNFYSLATSNRSNQSCSPSRHMSHNRSRAAMMHKTCSSCRNMRTRWHIPSWLWKRLVPHYTRKLSFQALSVHKTTEDYTPPAAALIVYVFELKPLPTSLNRQ